MTGNGKHSLSTPETYRERLAEIQAEVERQELERARLRGYKFGYQAAALAFHLLAWVALVAVSLVVVAALWRLVQWAWGVL